MPDRTRGALLLPTVAALALVTGVLVGVVDAPPARADFASQCAAPDRTVGASDPSINVGAGETVLVASSFTGGIDALPAGGTLCVGPGATLQGLYMNNAAGALVVAAGGSLVMPNVAVAAGFSLDVAGTASFAGLNVNGSAELHVAPQGTLTVTSGFNPAAGTFVNEGTFTVQGSVNLNGPVSFRNSGTLAVTGSTTVNGPLTNEGLATFSSGLTINGSGALHNSCVVDTTGALANNATGSTNAGLVRVTGNLTNNGTWAQAPSGVTSAVGLTDDGRVSGFGAYAFTGTTSVQGSFTGDSAADPVRVQTVAPPGRIFDVQTGTVVNVVRTTVDVPTELPVCANGPQPPPADVEATKTGPATVLEGGTVAYAVSIRNDGPADAVGVVASDTLPAGFTLDPASTTGVLSGGVLSWDVGTLTVGQTVTLAFSGTATAPAGSVLLNVVRSTATTPDPDPANNDGTSESAQVATDVLAVPPPPNQPPVADDLVRDTQTGALVDGTATATDPDAGQALTFSVVSGPAHGSFLLFPGGGFFYVSASDFAGVDAVVFQVCDNASPTPACDTGTITLNVRPEAAPDMATTFQGTPVVVPVLANDTDGAPLDPTAVTPPSNGAVALDPVTGTATYTPAPGFVGTDAFSYRICSPTEPTFCDTTTVTVTVLPVNLPPTVAPQTLTTTTGTPATGTLVMSDPNPGDTLTAFRGVPPRTGTAQVGTNGALVYVPRAGFAGRDLFGVIVCDDGTPVLCATGMVTVEVLPVADPDTATTAEGTAVDVAVTSNDLGLVDPPTVASVPSHGSVTFSGATARYVPAAGFTGTDTFEYTVCATSAPDLCATTTVTVTVTAAPPTPTPTPEPPTPTPVPTTPAPGPTPGGGGSLAGTGSTVGPVAAVALALLLGGGCAVLLSRRRRSSADD